MFTRNYWLYQAANFSGKSVEVCGDSSTKPEFVTVDGTTGKPIGNTSWRYSGKFGFPESSVRGAMQTPLFFDVSANSEKNSSTVGYTLNGNCYGVCFGSGNEPATIDDFKLSGASVLNCSCSVSCSHSYESDGSNGVMSVHYTITNNNDTEVVIGEIGIFGEWYCRTTSNKANNFYYMVERTVLETPVIIPAGGVGQITYVIQMNYPVG